MNLETLLLKQSKGTMLEGIAKQVVRQSFQDFNFDENSKSSNTLLLLFMVILFLLLVYGIPCGIYKAIMNLAGNDKSIFFALQIFYVIVLLSYFTYFAQIIIATFLLILVLIVLVFIK
jgi:hypothetical protein